MPVKSPLPDCFNYWYSKAMVLVLIVICKALWPLYVALRSCLYTRIVVQVLCVLLNKIRKVQYNYTKSAFLDVKG